MAAQDVLGQTARLASSSALLQVRGRPSLLPPHPPPAAARRGAAGASRAASFTGAVPGGHLRAERLHPALPLPGAHRRGQCQVRGGQLSGTHEASRGCGTELVLRAGLSLAKLLLMLCNMLLALSQCLVISRLPGHVLA